MSRLLKVGAALLVFLALTPFTAAAQDTGSDASRGTDTGFELQQNYPNPFNPVTRIPFYLGPSLFEDGDGATVTMRIFNVLQQLVAYPTALDHPLGNGVPVNELVYDRPGQYEAFWDGRDTSGRQVASSIYILQIIVDGQRKTMKMIVAK
ncbi:MAG: hypothetical protein P8177_14870 [Gemmatimonadota bacterium]|jgi:hypothetical protein